MPELKAAILSHESTPQPASEAMIDPELAALPAPSRPTSASAQPDPESSTTNNNGDVTNGNGSASTTTAYPYSLQSDDLGVSAALGITQSIASAPNPRPSEFNYTQIAEFPPSTLDDVDYDAIVNDGNPGSPTSKVMRAAVPHNAAQLEPKWPPVSETSIHTYITQSVPSEIRLDEREVALPFALVDTASLASKSHTSLWLFC